MNQKPEDLSLAPGLVETAMGFSELEPGLNPEKVARARTLRKALLFQYLQPLGYTSSHLTKPSLFAHALVEDIKNNPDKNRLVLIDGEAQSGKTQLGDEMATELANPEGELMQFAHEMGYEVFIGNGPWGDAYLMQDPTGGRDVPKGVSPSDFFREKAGRAAIDYMDTLKRHLGEPHPGKIYIIISDTIDGSAVVVNGQSYSQKLRAYEEKRAFIHGEGKHAKIRRNFQAWRIGLSASKNVVINNFKDRVATFAQDPGPNRDKALVTRGKTLYYLKGTEVIPFQAESASPINYADLRIDTNRSIIGLYRNGLLAVPEFTNLGLSIEEILGDERVERKLIEANDIDGYLEYLKKRPYEDLRQRIIGVRLNHWMAQDLGFDLNRTAHYGNNVVHEKGLDVSRDIPQVQRIFLEDYHERFEKAGLLQTAA